MTLHLDDVFRLSPNAYVVVDREHRLVAVNDAYLRATASTRDALLGKRLVEVFPHRAGDASTASTAMLRASLDRAFATGKADVLAVLPCKVPVATERGVSVEERCWSATHTPLVNATGIVEHVLQHTVDITELQRLQSQVDGSSVSSSLHAGMLERAARLQDLNATLDEERLRLLSLFKQTPSFMALTRGPTHVYEMTNDAFQQISGHRDVIGKTIREAFPELEGQGFFELVDSVYATATPFVGRGMGAMVQREQDGPMVQVYVDFIYQPVLDPAGKVIGIFTQGHDVTEQKAAELEVRTLNAALERRVAERTSELEDANKELESFSYSVSHDLRAPLRHIAAFAALLDRAAGASLSVLAKDYLKTIADAAREGGKLVDDLLNFSRMGRAELKRVPTNLGEMIGGLRTELATEVAGREIEWRVGALPQVVADPALFRGVMKNLLSNAIKYTRPTAHPVVEIGGEQGPREVHVWVKDNGVGFDMAYVDKLFGVFQRLHTPDAFEGTGIGLANVRRIVTRHGGRVWAEGKVGEGATFHLTVPTPHGDR